MINHDLGTEIHLRREQGESVEQMIAEMGSPQQIADRFHAEMEEYRLPRKNPLRFLFLAGMLLLVGVFAYQAYWYLFYQSVNAIGGADGPTAIYVTTGAVTTIWDQVFYLIATCLGCVAAYMLLGYGKCGKKAQFQKCTMIAGAGIVSWGIGLVITLVSGRGMRLGLVSISSLLVWAGLTIAVTIFCISIKRMR